MSTAESALKHLTAANPVPDQRVGELVPAQWSEQVLIRIRSEPIATTGRRSRRRWLIVAVAVFALLIAPTYAIARELIDGWLSGEPAPQSVVKNFESYTPQLGFYPDPSRAVLVATDRDVSLYATTNDKGSFCLAITGARDGGTCIAPASAQAPLIAGMVSGAPSGSSVGERLLIAGRVDNPEARTIRFTDPDGDVVTRAIGSSGFFIAAVPIHDSPCANGDWTPTFESLGANGEELVRATIVLARGGPGQAPLCSWTTPHP
jgi:hypothetical protein